MSANLIANRYAKALFELVQSAEDQKKTIAFLQYVSKMFEMPEVKKIFKSPVMPVALKSDLLSFALKESGAGESTKLFYEQLLTAGRAEVLPEIYTCFQALVDSKNGVAHGFFVTATPTGDATKQELEEKLSKIFKKRLSLQNKIDPRILGGTIIQVGNYAIDLSVKTKLDQAAEYAVVGSSV